MRCDLAQVSMPPANQRDADRKERGALDELADADRNDCPIGAPALRYFFLAHIHCNCHRGYTRPQPNAQNSTCFECSCTSNRATMRPIQSLTSHEIEWYRKAKRQSAGLTSPKNEDL